MTSKQSYHYTECGLDDVFLANGFTFANTPSGKTVSIKNIDGLHEAIGRFLVYHKKDLNGKELRFLRHEMLMSQDSLARLLEVGEQTIRRWEQGKSEISKPASSLIKMLYMEHIDGDGKIRQTLKTLADIEEDMDKVNRSIILEKQGEKWQAAA